MKVFNQDRCKKVIKFKTGPQGPYIFGYGSDNNTAVVKKYTHTARDLKIQNKFTFEGEIHRVKDSEIFNECKP
jgi:hypothetical protein